MYGTPAGGGGAPATKAAAVTVVGGPPPPAASAATKTTRGAKRGGAPVKEAIPMSDEAFALRLALDAAQENLDYYKKRVAAL